MAKHKKISIVHFANRQLKKVKIGDKYIYPIYFRITYERKRLNIKSLLFNSFTINSFKYNVDQDQFLDESEMIVRDTSVINKIIDKVTLDHDEFTLNHFKNYYKNYGKNMLEKVESELFPELLKVVKEDQLLNKIITGREEQFNIFSIMDIAGSIDRHSGAALNTDIPKIRENLNRSTGYVLGFIESEIQKTHRYPFMNMESMEMWNSSKEDIASNKYKFRYISKIEWNEMFNKSSASDYAYSESTFYSAGQNPEKPDTNVDVKKMTLIEKSISRWMNRFNIE